MENMNDIREKFEEYAEACVESSDELIQLLADFDRIVSAGTEYFEVEVWEDARYVLFHREDGKWDWVFEDPIEGHEYGGVFSNRRDAMYDMAKDADNTLVVDPDMGLRIRRAI